MASIRIILDKRRADEKGNYPAKIVITHNQTNAYISLNCKLPEKSWQGDGLERPVKHTHAGAKILNDQIQQLYIELRKKVSDLELSGLAKHVKASDIKKQILKTEIEQSKDGFISFASKFSQECKAERTKQLYILTAKKLNEYTGQGEIGFEEITNQFLRQFDSWLADTGSGVNTRSIHFRNIRAIFNRAIDDDVIPQNLYPFRKFKVKSAEKEKVSLTARQIKMLYEYEFTTLSLRMARDYFMLSFFLCGINPVDLYNLKKPENGHIVFVRAKMQGGNHNTIRLLIQPEAQAIIDRYKSSDDSPYLLNFIDRYLSYDIFKSFLCKKIREIAVIMGFKGMTMYWARYSWATIADGLDIPEKTISKGLGHVDKSMAGRKYIAFDWSKVDRANRNVIDNVLSYSNVKNS